MLNAKRLTQNPKRKSRLKAERLRPNAKNAIREVADGVFKF